MKTTSRTALVFALVVIGWWLSLATGSSARCGEPGASPGASIVKRQFTGNYELNLEIQDKGTGSAVRLFFSGDKNLNSYAFLDVFDGGFTLGRQMDNTQVVWKKYEGVGSPPWKVKMLKKGNFYRYEVNNVKGWMRSPLAEWEKKYDPWESFVGVEAGPGVKLRSFTATTLPWLDQVTQPVIPKGPEGSYYEEQAIPGAVLEYKGMYYMYFMAGMKGNEEGSSRRSIGLAVSSDLRTWKVRPEPVLTYKDFPYDNLYVNGAVQTPEGKIAVMFSAQVFPEWKGFMLATASHPEGPFTPHVGNPVYKHFTHAHEFDLVRVDQPDRRYILFYAGFTPKPPTGPVGDRGYLVYSDDLIHWTADKANPVFSPQTLDNWDAAHIRPRSLTMIGDMWYLWYEGCNNWDPPGPAPGEPPHHGWWDTVGLARSRDLLNWEHYPRNPALPALGVGPEQFDNKWVGWPRMVVKDGTGYVFYTGGSPDSLGGVHIGVRTIPISALTNWDSEGGETIDLLQGK